MTKYLRGFFMASLLSASGADLFAQAPTLEEKTAGQLGADKISADLVTLSHFLSEQYTKGHYSRLGPRQFVSYSTTESVARSPDFRFRTLARISGSRSRPFSAEGTSALLVSTTASSAQGWKTSGASPPSNTTTTAGQATSDTATGSPRLSVVPLYLSDRRPLAILKIGDLPPAPVIFDTGTSGNALDTDYVAAAKLEYIAGEEMQVLDGSSGNSFTAKQARLLQASIGGVPLVDEAAVVYPYKERDVVGIFGPNSFVGSYVLLDLGNARLIIKDKTGLRLPSNPGIPYFNAGTETALPGLELEVAGQRMTAVLDTGNTSPLLLPYELAKKLPLSGPLRLAGKAVSVAGEQSIYEGQLQGTVRIGPLVLENPVVRFAGRHANVGLPMIRQLLIMLDPETQQSWVLPPAGAIPQELTAFTGTFENRTLQVENDVLFSQVDGGTALALRYIGEDLFVNDRTGDMLQFRRKEEKVTEFDLVRSSGTATVVVRTHN